MDAFHVDLSMKWSVCVELNYSTTIRTVLPFYQRVLARGLRILVYSFLCHCLFHNVEATLTLLCLLSAPNDACLRSD
jgi:hypothetical protein